MHLRNTLRLAGTLALACSAPALAQSGGPFDLTWNSIDGGGTTSMSGAQFVLSGSIGQHDANGSQDGSAYDVLPGFMTVPGESGPCAPADLAEPFGALDFFDVLAFLGLFDAMDPAADLAPPLGAWDFFDVLEYLGLFDAGCP